MDGRTEFAISGDGTRIAFEAHGTGAPVLLLHGFSESRASWTAAGYTGALVAAGSRVVLVDARGHGQSGRPASAAACSGRHVLGDLAAVLDALGLRQAAVMGFSMGGVTALAAAALLPERVAAAMAVGAHPFAEDLSWLRGLLAGGLAGWVGAVERGQGGLDPATRARIMANDMTALRAAIASDRSDVSGALAASGRPVLAVLGDRDPRHAAAAPLRRLPGAEVLSLAGVDHFGSFLAAREVLPEITRFLARSLQEVA